jgi:hypothetical protein
MFFWEGYDDVSLLGGGQGGGQGGLGAPLSTGGDGTPTTYAGPYTQACPSGQYPGPGGCYPLGTKVLLDDVTGQVCYVWPDGTCRACPPRMLEAYPGFCVWPRDSYDLPAGQSSCLPGYHKVVDDTGALTTRAVCVPILPCASGIYDGSGDCMVCSGWWKNGACKACPAGTFLNTSTGQCTSVCASGYTLNPATGQCVAASSCPTCPTSCAPGFFVSSQTGQCMQCAPGTYYDAVRKVCLPFPTPQCPAGQLWDTAAARCVTPSGPLPCPSPTCPTCPPGKLWDFATSTCVDEVTGQGEAPKLWFWAMAGTVATLGLVAAAAMANRMVP